VGESWSRSATRTGGKYGRDKQRALKMLEIHTFFSAELKGRKTLLARAGSKWEGNIKWILKK
jgi:hypothetical protein